MAVANTLNGGLVLMVLVWDHVKSCCDDNDGEDKGGY